MKAKEKISQRDLARLLRDINYLSEADRLGVTLTGSIRDKAYRFGIPSKETDVLCRAFHDTWAQITSNRLGELFTLFVAIAPLVTDCGGGDFFQIIDWGVADRLKTLSLLSMSDDLGEDLYLQDISTNPEAVLQEA